VGERMEGEVEGFVGGETFGGWSELVGLGPSTAGKPEGRSESGVGRKEQSWNLVRLSGGREGGNAVNPTIGCGMQQARSARAEKTVEAGRNGKGGTSPEVANPGRRRPRAGACTGWRKSGVDARSVCR